MKFEIDLNPSEKDDQVILDGIVDFNVRILGEKSKHLCIFAKDNEKIIGGASIWEQSDALYIKHLWIEEKHRKKDIGTKLLKMAEEYASEKKLKKLYVDTYSFQAQDFYKKNGYSSIGKIKDYLLGYDRIFLRKNVP